MGWGDRKPPLGTQVDRSHPLAKGLVFCFPFNEMAGNAARDVVTPGGRGITMVRQTAGNPWAWPNYRLEGTTNWARTGSIPPVWKLNPPLSIVWQGYPIATFGSVTNYIFGIIYSDPGAAPWTGVAFFNNAGGAWLHYNRNTATEIKQSLFPHDDHLRKHQYVGAFGSSTIDGTNYVVGYYNGDPRVGDATSIPTIGYTATSWLILGQSGNMNTEMVALYDRTLSRAEQVWLRAEPYAMYLPPRRTPAVFDMAAGRLFRQDSLDGMGGGGPRHGNPLTRM